jgi:hypothetical protein
VLVLGHANGLPMFGWVAKRVFLADEGDVRDPSLCPTHQRLGRAIELRIEGCSTANLAKVFYVIEDERH